MDKLRLLIVDDSPVMRMVIAKQLEKLGFMTDVAEDGLQAVVAVKETAYDLIFMDIMMPNLDGLEATKRIRKFEKEAGRAPAIVVGVTGYTNRAECISAGMNDFLFKPVTIEQLKSTIVNWHPHSELAATIAPAHLFPDDDKSDEARDPIDQRIDDLKRRLGYN